MFGFGKKARQEKARREVVNIGDRAVGSLLLTNVVSLRREHGRLIF